MSKVKYINKICLSHAVICGISEKFIPNLSIDEEISFWGNRMLYSFLLHQFRVEK